MLYVLRPLLLHHRFKGKNDRLPTYANHLQTNSIFMLVLYGNFCMLSNAYCTASSAIFLIKKKVIFKIFNKLKQDHTYF